MYNGGRKARNSVTTLRSGWGGVVGEEKYQFKTALQQSENTFVCVSGKDFSFQFNCNCLILKRSIELYFFFCGVGGDSKLVAIPNAF